jgi:hypothetical protein
MSVFIPEIVIYNQAKAVQVLMRRDFASKTDESKTFLYRMFSNDYYTNNPLFIEDFDFYKEAKSLIIDSKDTAKNFEICMGYNMNRSNAPTAHIMMPNETSKGAPIGSNEGYRSEFEDGNNIIRSEFTQGTSVVYNLLFTSDNASQVIILYHLYKNAFFGLTADFAFKGFMNLSIGGSDLQFDDSFIPPNIFHRNLTLSFDYDSVSFDLTGRETGSNFIFE